ncbi:Transcription factor MYB3R-3 [Frankliniella fusca]|uniref:Transcription factor MYB3R-3 n=1 Tax=Frankliniella fusca TaxID=407009 RepID=A0AAE1LC89_9NEOP|nr:Transcription factor MYB3R-3 [Frankliniella fusca]
MAGVVGGLATAAAKMPGRWGNAVVEVLLLQKRDFDNVLKASIMKTWEEIREAMAGFHYFEHWGEVALRETCILAKISHFKTGDTILGDGHGQPNMAYFLIRGRARLIQHLLLVPKVSSTGLVKYRCLPPGTTTFPAGTQTHFMQVAVFSKGECFGIGEDMQDRRVVAATPVSALLVPRYVLQQRGHGNLWARIRRFLNSRFPSQDALLKHFLNGRDWAKYRRDLVMHLLQGRPPLADTTVHDVPLSLRTRDWIPLEKHSCYELGRLPDPRASRWRAAREERAAVERRVAAAKREQRAELAFKARERAAQRGVKFA